MIRCADALRGADPLADDGADDRRRRRRSSAPRTGRAARRRSRSLKKISVLTPTARASAPSPAGSTDSRPAHHVDQRREEADQRRDGDLRRVAVAEQQHQDRRLGHDRDRVDEDRRPGKRPPRRSGCARRSSRWDRRDVAEQEAASASMTRRHAGCAISRPSLVHSVVSTATGDGAMNGGTSKITQTSAAHEDDQDRAMPATGSSRRRHSSAAPGASHAPAASAVATSDRAAVAVGRRSSAPPQQAAQARGELHERRRSRGSSGRGPAAGRWARSRDAARVGRQHQHLLAEEDRLVDAVGDEQDRRAGLVPDPAAAPRSAGRG